MGPSLVVILSLLLVKVSGQQDKLSDDLLRKTTTFFFGPLWKQDEYCGRLLTEAETLDYDTHFESFYNGSIINKLQDLDGRTFLNAVNQLSYIDIESRNLLTTTCSSNAWGYAEDANFKLSNLPNNNPIKCRSLVEDLYNLIEYIDAQHLTNPQEEAKIGIAKRNHTLSDIILSNPTPNPLMLWNQFNHFGRITSGPILFKQTFLGDYRGCTSDKETRYCHGAYRMSKWPMSSSGSGAFRVGLCLPRSCDSKSANSVREKIDILIKKNLVSIQGLTNSSAYKLTDIYCPPAQDSYYLRLLSDPLSTALLLLLLIWITLLVYATTTLDEKCPSLLNNFNLRHNWSSFTRKQKSSLAGLNCIKSISAVNLINCHLFILIMSQIENLHRFNQDYSDSLGVSIIYQGQHGVPVYFFISGLLVGHKYLGRRLDTKKFILNRYLRLLPMYLVLYTVQKKFGHLLGSGPFWDYGVSVESEARQCRQESWLVPFLMLANFITPYTHCVLTGWHIANDFQIYLMLPLLLGIYKRSKSWGRYTVLLTFVISHLYHVWNFGIATSFEIGPLFNIPYVFGIRIIMDRIVFDYINPFGRLGNYYGGVMLADFLFVGRDERNDRKTCESTENTPALTQSKGADNQEDLEQVDTRNNFYLSMLGCFMVFFTMISITTPPSMRFMFGSLSKALSYPICRVIAELGWFLILYAILYSNRKGVNQFHWMKRPFWDITAKLNYTIVVSHYLVVRYFVLSRTELFDFNWPNYLQLAIFIIMISHLFALVLHLCVEQPLTALVRRIESKLWD